MQYCKYQNITYPMQNCWILKCFRDLMVVSVKLFWVLWKVYWSMPGRMWALLLEVVFTVSWRI